MKITRFFKLRPYIARVLREPNATGCDRKRRAKCELPDEQERHHPAEPPGVVNLLKESVRPTRPRHCRSELSPYESIAHHKHGAEYPPEHRLRAIHRRDNRGDRNERADPDHVDHVQRCRACQTDASNQMRSGICFLNGFGIEVGDSLTGVLRVRAGRHVASVGRESLHHRPRHRDALLLRWRKEFKPKPGLRKTDLQTGLLAYARRRVVRLARA